jgi:hypothetical protein
MKTLRKNRIFELLTIILMAQFMLSGFGFCGHHHHDDLEHKFIHHDSDYSVKDDCCSHTKNTDQKKQDPDSCRCGCLGHTIAIHDNLLTSFDLSVSEKSIATQSIYKFEWIPSIYRPPLN